MAIYPFLKNKTVLLIFCFICACILRFPGIKFDLEPFPYCDEDLFIVPALNMIESSNWRVPHFKSGGLNFIIPLSIGSIYQFFSSELISLENLRIIARFFSTVLLASLAVFPIYGAIKIQTRSQTYGVIGAFLFAISPLSTAASTWFYPDGYIAFFAASSIYFSDRFAASRGNSSNSLFLLMGGTLGAAISVKYNAAILFGYFLLTLVVGEQKTGFTGKIIFKRFVNKKTFLVASWTFIFFLALNTRAFKYYDQFLHDLNIKHYVMSNDFFHGWMFYFSLYFLFTIGLTPIFCVIAAFFDAKRLIFITLRYLTIPIIYILLIGRYNLLFSRNLQIIIPFLCILVPICLEFVISNQLSKRKKLITAVFFALLVGVCLTRTLNQFSLDLKKDSRRIAKNLILENNWQEVYSNEGCGQKPIIGTVSELPKYIALDSWFGGVNEFGEIRTVKQESLNAIAQSSHLRDLHYLNHIGCWNWKLKFSFSELLSFYKLHTIVRGGGPAVVIFQRKAE